MNNELREKTKSTTRRKLLVTCLIVIGVGFVVVMFGVSWQLHEANTAVHRFTDALIAKQYETAYDSASKEFRESVDFSTFVKVHDALTVRMGELKSVEITESEVKEKSDGWHGTAEADLTFSRGSLTFTFILKKENHS
jgi:hypothetical protein